MCKKKVYEWCPYCEQEVKLKAEFAVQTCPSCGMRIVPCSMCDDCDSCDDCPLDKQAEKENGER